MPNISFVGLGTMGTPMVHRLLESGHAVYITDVNDAVVRELSNNSSAKPVDSPADVENLSIVILMLPNSGVVSNVLGDPNDPGSLFRRLPKGTLIIDMSSSQPSMTRLNADYAARVGVRFVDAPVSGGPRKATSGELTIMVGGKEEDYSEALPVLRSMGTAIVRVGEVGSAHALKALNNLLSATGIVGALEVLAVGKAFGLAPGIMLDVINSSTGRNQATEVKIGQQVLTRKFGVGFSLELTVKDLRTAIELARSQDIMAPVSEATFETFSKALEFLEGERADQSQVAEYLESKYNIRYDS